MLEVNYVSAVQATLRDQVATIYNRVGTVKNGERVEVFSTHTAADADVVAKADRALKLAESRAGIQVSQRPRLRVFPSVAAFRDATGEPASCPTIVATER